MIDCSEEKIDAIYFVLLAKASKGAVTPDGIPAHIPAFFFPRGMRRV